MENPQPHFPQLRTTADQLKQLVVQGKLSPKIADSLEEFFSGYRKALIDHPASKREAHERTLHLFMDKVVDFIHHPYVFPPYHQRILEPFDYSELNDLLWAPLVDFEHSILRGEKHLKQIQEALRKKENVIFLANHQTEPDTQVLMLLLNKHGFSFAYDMIFVAGDRVITDPLAAPLSLGLNLLCVFSKRYMDAAPEKREERQQHNRRTMQKMGELLAEGGKCIYVAPSGGRDRPAADGSIPIAPFDPSSIEMFRLMAEKSSATTHFYPMSLYTHPLLPPPKTIQIELGEQRSPSFTPISVTIGEEILWQNLPTDTDKHMAREKRARAIWETVHANYLPL